MLYFGAALENMVATEESFLMCAHFLKIKDKFLRIFYFGNNDLLEIFELRTRILENRD